MSVPKLTIGPKSFSDSESSSGDELMEIVYRELRQLAKNYLRRERENHTLQPTALVHEAYLRILAQEKTVWKNREQFIGVAATMMRRILVNYAIKRKREKRGGGDICVALGETSTFIANDNVSIVALDEALSKFVKQYPRQGRIVELRFFGGLSTTETAQFLNVSERTVERGWRFARTWLQRELNGGF